MTMSKTSIRNKHGDLTKHALSKGYTDQRAWRTVDMTTHTVTLSSPEQKYTYFNPELGIEPYVGEYEVAHDQHSPITGHQQDSWIFAEHQLEEARARFKKEARQ